MGRDAKDKAVVEMWNRRAELDGFLAVGETVRNALPMFEDRALPGMPGGVPQIPALVDRGRQSFERFLTRIDDRLGQSPFLAGADFTIADITAFIAVEVGARAELTVADTYRHVTRWHGDVAKRPSAEA